MSFQMKVKRKLNESYPESLNSSVEFQSPIFTLFTLIPEAKISDGRKLKSKREGENCRKDLV